MWFDSSPLLSLLTVRGHSIFMNAKYSGTLLIYKYTLGTKVIVLISEVPIF